MNEPALLLLGSNMGDPIRNFSDAMELIGQQIGPLVKASSLYRTKAWGKTDQPDFLNQVIEIDFHHTPEVLLEKVLAIELQMGRVREIKWGARLIDIDLLFVGDMIISSENLKLPHPEIANRRFTLEPLAEIHPGLTHPVLKKTILQLLKDCKDELPVTKIQR